jgi:hypothetical protein
MTCTNAVLELAWNCGEPLVVPLYSPVMLCGLAAAESADVVHVAVLRVSGTAVQSGDTPSLKVTVPTPFGFPPAAVTVAVNVTEAPYALGLTPAVLASAVDVERVFDTTTLFCRTSVSLACWLHDSSEYAMKYALYVAAGAGAVTLNVSAYDPLPSWLGLLKHVTVPEVVAILHPVLRQFALPAPLSVVTETVAAIVAPGATSTVVEPFNVADTTVRPSVKVTRACEAAPRAVRLKRTPRC